MGGNTIMRARSSLANAASRSERDFGRFPPTNKFFRRRPSFPPIIDLVSHPPGSIMSRLHSVRIPFCRSDSHSIPSRNDNTEMSGVLFRLKEASVDGRFLEGALDRRSNLNRPTIALRSAMLISVFAWFLGSAKADEPPTHDSPSQKGDITEHSSGQGMAKMGMARVDSDGSVQRARVVFFETKIRPVLAENCFECHSASTGGAEGGLLLDTRSGMLAGGERGEVIVAGDPEKSRLLRVIRHEVPDLEMPPHGKRLPDKVLADFATWIRQGAHIPEVADRPVRDRSPPHRPLPTSSSLRTRAGLRAAPAASPRAVASVACAAAGKPRSAPRPYGHSGGSA